MPPRKRLPLRPSLEHLRKQAKRLCRLDPELTLGHAQLRLARDYGCRSWAELVHVVDTMTRGSTELHNVSATPQPLPRAVRSRDLDLVRSILSTGQFTPHDLDAALAHAAWYGGDQPEVLKVRKQLFDLLLEHGADPDGQYGSSYGPLVLGCGECQSVEGLQWLIDAGCDVTFPPVSTKYGLQCPLYSWTGTYIRGDNTAKHRGIELLLRHQAFIPPELTPEMLAIHRGDTDTFGRLVSESPRLLTATYPDMPHGNLLLAGATLLHLALEIGERPAAELLCRSGANLNAPARSVNGFGRQTPVFHLIASIQSALLPTLEWFLRDYGKSIDFSLRCDGLRFSDGSTLAEPLTPLDYAYAALRPSTPDWRRSSEREIELLRSAGATLSKPVLPDDTFAAAVSAIDSGQIEELRKLLAAHPQLLSQRADEQGLFGGNYFKGAKLLHFIAENPIRTGRMPPNIADITRAIIDTGAAAEDIQYTLGLVVSGRIPREQGRTRELAAILVSAGADPTEALLPAIANFEVDSIHILLGLGATLTPPAAAATGNLAPLLAALPTLTAEQHLTCLAAAVLHRQHAAARAVLAGGQVDPSAFLPAGMHSHSTALHQAAYLNDPEMIALLLAAGARTDLPDKIHHSTPRDWAAYARNDAALRALPPH
jgi:peptide-methionine (S)-S-oxide reductase